MPTALDNFLDTMFSEPGAPTAPAQAKQPMLNDVLDSMFGPDEDVDNSIDKPQDLNVISTLANTFTQSLAEKPAAMLQGATAYTPGESRGLDKKMVELSDYLTTLRDPEKRQQAQQALQGHLWPSRTDTPWYDIDANLVPNAVNGWAAQVGDQIPIFIATQLGRLTGRLLGTAAGAVAGVTEAVATGGPDPTDVVGAPATFAIVKKAVEHIGGAAPMVLMETGDYLDIAQNEGIDKDIAEKYARLYGPSAGAIEYVQQMWNMKALKGITEPVKKKMIGRLLTLIGGNIWEGLEEVSQGGLERFLINKAKGEMRERDPSYSRPDVAVFSKAESGREFGIGFGIGTIASTAGEVTQTARQIIQTSPDEAKAFADKPTPSRKDMETLGLPASSEAIRKALADEIRSQLQTETVDNVVSEETPVETTASEPLQQEAVGEQAASVTFKTAKGSEYVVNDDETTTRNKKHSEDAGQKEKSQFTAYVTPEDALRLSEIQTQGGPKSIIGFTEDGKMGKQYMSGKDAGKFERRTVVSFSTTPAVGLTPVEIWDGGSTHHFGNKIVEISSPSSTEAVQAESQPPQKLTPDGKIKTVEPEKPQRKPLAVKQKGQDFDVALPNSDKRVSGKWAVVEESDIITSSGKDYDPTLQPRNRQSAASREQIAAMASKLDPSQLQDSAVADTGAPIIDQYGQVISGNGRTEAIRVAYKQGSGKAYKDSVKAMAESKGLSVEGMKKPVLVRAMEDTGGLSVQQVAELANRSNILQRSEAELAEADAKAIVENDMMRLYFPDESGSVRAKTNQDFLNLFVEKTGAGNLRLSSGEYSPAIEKRVKSAVLAAILGNSDNARKVVTQAIERSEELGIKRQIDGLMQVGGQLLKLARSKPEFDISSDISTAMDQLMQFKRSFQKGETTLPADWTKQMTMFGEGMSKAQKILFTEFSGMKSAKDMAEYIGSYIDIASKIDAGPSLFGEKVQPQTPIELLENIENEKRKAETDSKRNLFDGGTKADSQRSEVKPEGKGTGDGVTGTETGVAIAKILSNYNGNIDNMTGPSNADNRQRIMELITGQKVPKSKAGYNAVRDALYEFINAPKDVILAQKIEYATNWAKETLQQESKVSEKPVPPEVKEKKLTPDGKVNKPAIPSKPKPTQSMIIRRGANDPVKVVFTDEDSKEVFRGLAIERKKGALREGSLKNPGVLKQIQDKTGATIAQLMDWRDSVKAQANSMPKTGEDLEIQPQSITDYLSQQKPAEPKKLSPDGKANKPSENTIFSEEKRNEILRKQAERAEAARKERGGNDKRSGHQQIFTKEDLADAAYLLGYEAERGIRTLAAFTKKAIEMFGEGIRKHIPQLWADTRKALNIPDEPKKKLTPDGKIKKDEPAKSTKVKSKSVLANELADHLKAEGRLMNLEYDEMSIQKQVEDTQKLIEENIDEAVRIAYGGENNTGIPTSAIKAGLFFQAKAEGNWELAQKFADISFNHNVAAGQEVAVLKGLITDNSPLKWYAVLKNNLIEAAAKKFGVGKEGSATKKVMERVKKEVAKATEKMSLKQMKIADAQAFIESLKC